MADNTTASLDKLSCTNYVDSGKGQEKNGQFFWSKKDSDYLDVNRKMLKRDDNRDFCPVQNLRMGEADFH